jgi:hypothetical protein
MLRYLQVGQLEHSMSSLPAALEEVRLLLGGAGRDVLCSEGAPLQACLAAQLRAVAHASKKRILSLATVLRAQLPGAGPGAGAGAGGHVHVHPSHFVGNAALSAVNARWLGEVSLPLRHMGSMLAMLETSLAADVLMELLQMDLDSDSDRGEGEGAGAGAGVGAAPPVYSFSERHPASVSELLGALLQVSEGSAADLRAMAGWSPLDTSSFAFRQCILPRRGPGGGGGRAEAEAVLEVGQGHTRVRLRPNGEPLREEAEAYVLDTEAEEAALTMDAALARAAFSPPAHGAGAGAGGGMLAGLLTTAPARRPPRPGRFASRFLRVYPGLGVAWGGRLGAVDAVAALLDEVSRPALPCPALPCLALPCLALSCLALSCLALSCLALPCLSDDIYVYAYVYAYAYGDAGVPIRLAARDRRGGRAVQVPDRHPRRQVRCAVLCVLCYVCCAML